MDSCSLPRGTLSQARLGDARAGRPSPRRSAGARCLPSRGRYYRRSGRTGRATRRLAGRRPEYRPACAGAFHQQGHGVEDARARRREEFRGPPGDRAQGRGDQPLGGDIVDEEPHPGVQRLFRTDRLPAGARPRRPVAGRPGDRRPPQSRRGSENADRACRCPRRPGARCPPERRPGPPPRSRPSPLRSGVHDWRTPSARGLRRVARSSSWFMMTPLDKRRKPPYINRSHPPLIESTFALGKRAVREGQAG